MPVVHTTLVPFLPREVTMLKIENFSDIQILRQIIRIASKNFVKLNFSVVLQNDFTEFLQNGVDFSFIQSTAYAGKPKGV